MAINFNFGAGDFNGDGKCDIALRKMQTGQIWFRLSDGKGGFSEVWGHHQWTPDTPGDWYQFAAGDFNGDGICDIALWKEQTGQVWIRLGDGKGGFSEVWNPHQWTPNSVGGPYQFVAGDFNGDGKCDIALRKMQTGQIWFRLSDGKGGFSEVWGHHQWTPDTPGDWYQFAAGDFNGDGICDIALWKEQTGQVWIRLGDGKGGFSEVWNPHQWTPNSVGGPYQFVAGDFNGDGKCDIALRKMQTGQIWFRLSDGKGGFSEVWGHHQWTGESEEAEQLELYGYMQQCGAVLNWSEFTKACRECAKHAAEGAAAIRGGPLTTLTWALSSDVQKNDCQQCITSVAGWVGNNISKDRPGFDHLQRIDKGPGSTDLPDHSGDA